MAPDPDGTQIDRLRPLSDRAEITLTRFGNTYNYGDFRGSPKKMMEDYFDAHVYVSNFGVNELMLRFPRGVISEQMFDAYVVGSGTTRKSEKYE